jgi:starch synthase
VRVLMVASECVPLVKTGGLADMVGGLSRALVGLGCDVRIVMPNYPEVAERVHGITQIARYDDLFGGPAALSTAVADNGQGFVLLDAPHLFARAGNPYLGPDGKDHSDNHLRFAALCRAAARLVVEQPDGWSVDVVHGHDWQAGLTSAYLSLGDAGLPPTVFTIHNIAFAGLFPAGELTRLGLPASLFHPEGLEFYGQVSFLKAGLVFSDRLTTVSPTYARQLQSAELGMGFEGVLMARRNRFSGILNGIDESIWNPETDPLIANTFLSRSLVGKRANRAALQSAMNLDADATSLLFVVVSRLTDQKGLDLLAAAIPGLVAQGGQLALLGSGSPELESLFKGAAMENPGRVAVRMGYDEPLSHLLIAGGDAILVPSRFEPCGLTQLYGLRYGTIPIVARTGGLGDSVIDANEAALTVGTATGVLFGPDDLAELERGIARSFELFSDRTAWESLIQAAMRQPVGWDHSAATYRRIYELARGDRFGR